ncbi:Glycosyltransferase involved in cell wall bisynthesis [Paenibacillus sp. UNCCL117]|uniref:glycosyltransferase family 2 protein n=1 Tax=unclassified Paenibacillus TaxID=185978 RepID=UPI00088ED51B|nr:MULTISPECIES: glycosyltransferase family 2 protein [unclassified Paenibacillus]SDC02968.1 Glycosyltransferase involved in cell wall bisynthesis [Paenibacillus sp. cl123]SFW36968.1 Glycosyltransferase involved in cell wall bisynthesis [Paenibacillus sp. UNCCL117]
MTAVSVLLPTRNRAGYLRLAIGSVLAQTFGDFELLVLDDGSTDHTQRLVESFADPRIRYYRHPTRLGMASNWNFGVEHSRGRYVAFLHDDDEWEPEFLKTAAEALDREPEAALVFTDHWLMNGEGELLVEETRVNSRLWGRERLGAGLHQPFGDLAVVVRPIHIVSMMFRRNLLPSLREGLESGSVIDYWMVVQLALKGRGAYYIPERLSRYRVHAGSETATGRLRTCPGYIWMFRYLLQEPACAVYEPYLRKKLIGSYVGYGSALLQAKRYKESRRAFASAWLLERTNKAAIGGWLLSYLPDSLFHRARRFKHNRMEVS